MRVLDECGEQNLAEARFRLARASRQGEQKVLSGRRGEVRAALPRGQNSVALFRIGPSVHACVSSAMH